METGKIKKDDESILIKIIMRILTCIGANKEPKSERPGKNNKKEDME